MSKDRNAFFTYFYLLTLLFLFPFQTTNCQDYNHFSLIDDTNTLINVIKFEDFLLNNFAKNNNGDLVVEFSSSNESSARQFYEIKEDGENFFSDVDYLKINVETNEETYNDGLDSSKNLFVSMNDNTYTEYLFSINAYNSTVELYDLDNNKYYIWSFNKFFDLNLDEYYSPCSYEIFSLKKEKSYIIAFLPKEKISSEIFLFFFITCFRFFFIFYRFSFTWRFTYYLALFLIKHC